MLDGIRCPAAEINYAGSQSISHGSDVSLLLADLTCILSLQLTMVETTIAFSEMYLSFQQISKCDGSLTELKVDCWCQKGEQSWRLYF